MSPPLPPDLSIGSSDCGNPYSADEQIEALEAAEDNFPDSDFAASCRDQWDAKGFLTAKQVETLLKVAQATPPERGFGHFD